jgi:hypothetical protein
MSATVTIMEYKNNKTIIYRKDTKLTGKMFQEPMRSIMGAEVPQLNKLLKKII